MLVLGQYTLFNENVGTTATGNPLVTVYTGWGTSLTFGATISASPTMSAADVRTNSVSSGYTGASGGSNVFITSTIGKNFQISSISTIGKFNLKLSFGALKSTTASNMSELVLEFSIDGTNYIPLIIPIQPTGAGTGVWRLIPPISLPSSADNVSNLRLRWRQTSTPQFRIDDIKLTYETALPIELISFDGTNLESYNFITWSSASEHNNDYYLLERSTDGIDWSVINNQKGAGNSSIKIDYSFRDFTYESTINYYRLSQVDFDGNSETFKTIVVNNLGKSKQILFLTNILGQIVDDEATGILIVHYTDGTSEKIYK